MARDRAYVHIQAGGEYIMEATVPRGLTAAEAAGLLAQLLERKGVFFDAGVTLCLTLLATGKQLPAESSLSECDVRDGDTLVVQSAAEALRSAMEARPEKAEAQPSRVEAQPDLAEALRDTTSLSSDGACGGATAPSGEGRG